MNIESASTTSRDLNPLMSPNYHQLKDNEFVNPKDVKSALTPLQAIRAKCLDSAGTWYEVKNCRITDCPVHPYRHGQEIPEGLSKTKLIREKCMYCANGIKQQIRHCPSTACPLYPFRMGKNPNRARKVDKLN